MNFLNIEPCAIELYVIAFYRICRSLLSNLLIITVFRFRENVLFYSQKGRCNNITISYLIDV